MYGSARLRTTRLATVARVPVGVPTQSPVAGAPAVPRSGTSDHWSTALSTNW